MAISNLSGIVIKAMGEAKIKEIESQKGGFDFVSKVRDVEKELNSKGIEYIPGAMQALKGLFGSYVKDWEYNNIEQQVRYNVK